MSFSDIDECSGGSPCHADATCQNQIGSYECICNQGRLISYLMKLSLSIQFALKHFLVLKVIFINLYLLFSRLQWKWSDMHQYR